MSILGLHHITLVCSNARRTVDFYTRVLGLRLVKQTVNFDDPGSYHLYFGDEAGRPGTTITYYEWSSAPRGHWGIGGTHHFALNAADYEALLMWKRRLNDLGIQVDGPLDRHYFTSIYFQDPDGVIVEIATNGPGWAVDEAPESIGTEFRAPPPEMLVNNRDDERIRATTWPDAIPEITPRMQLSQGLHHITAIGSDIERTNFFVAELLGMRRVKMTSNFDDPGSAHWYWGAGEGRPGTLVTYFERDPKKVRRARMGTGQTHHFALAVPDNESLLNYREKLLNADFEVSPVRDRGYFQSIYTNDPDGQIIELATLGPGLMMDEPFETLGSTLKLPAWLEPERETIVARLQPLRTNE